jgi:hypothetical protein
MAENTQLDAAQPVESVDDLPTVIAVEAPPAEEQPRLRLTDKLHDVPEFDLADHASEVHRDYLDALSDRLEWEDKLDQGYRRYLNETTPKDFPWEGAANFHPPVTMTDVETLKPRLIEAIVGQEPKVLVIPVGPEDDDKAELTELFLNWQVDTELDIFALADESAHLFLVAGVVWGKIRWDRRYRKIKAIRKFPPTTSLDIIFQTLFGQAVPEDLERQPGEDFVWKGKLRMPGGRRTDVAAEFAFFEDEIQVLLDKEELQFEGASVEFPDPEDVIAPARAGRDPQKFRWLQHRLWMSEDELRQRARRGQFDREIVEEVIRRGPTGMDDVMDADGARQTLDRQEGVDPESSDMRADMYCVLEDYRAKDIDEDGYSEEIVSWVAEPHKLTLGWDYLDNVNASGKRPFEKEVFMPLPNRTLGLSLPEMIREVQDEMSTMHNQRVDYGTIGNLPFYFYRSTSMLKPTQHRLRPGEGVPVDNPQTDILFPQFRTNTAFGFQEEALLQQYNERLTGVTDMALGRQPNRVGATRTATGVASLLSESGLRFKVFMSRFQEFWRRIYIQILALDQQYLPPGKEFRVTGRPEVIRIQDRTEIQGKFDLRLSATTETLNKQSMRETAQIKLTTMMNPVFLQSQTMGLNGIFELAKDFLKAYGERDPLRILQAPQFVPPKEPVQEHAMFLSGAGKDVHPSPAEDMQRHIMEHYFFLDQPESAFLTAEGRELLLAHIAETQQMAFVMQMAQQMGGAKGGKAGAMGPGGVQGMNAQTGRAQPQLGPGPAQPQGGNGTGAPMAQGMGVGPFA